MESKVIIVTGSSRGVGLEISKALLNEGFLVVGISRLKSKPLEHFNFHWVQADLSKIEAIPKLAVELVAKFGIPYGLVNNAASGLDGLLATQSNADIVGTIESNLLSPILLSKYLGRQMLQNSEGRIVNISSVVATTGYSGLSVYAATKAGLIGFSKSLSREFGRRGVTVNSILPGFMHTQMTDQLEISKLEKIKRRSALRTLVKPEDVAQLVVFLMSKAGTRITGSSYILDAGNSA